MPIQILPPQLANQIAAGEVVERPASVVKELVENSLDAGASHIQIDIENGGATLIRIRDNGIGIAKEELSLALARHATSKISSLEDLEAILSLGFRGEALASISSVSRLTLTSRTQDQNEAWQVYAQGRDMETTLKPASHPVGTTVEVANLFFNTPARRKFLRTDKTEFSHIDEVIRRIALVKMQVAFNLTHNGKLIRQYKSAVQTSQVFKRVAAICGEDFMQNALQIDWQHDDLHLRGWVGLPHFTRPQNDLTYCYVNGRMVRDKVINHAIRQAYAEHLISEQYPAFVLFLDLNPNDVDVNVHPTKHEVRFQQQRLIHDFIYQGISHALHSKPIDLLTESQDSEQAAQVAEPQANWSVANYKPNRAAAGQNIFTREHSQNIPTDSQFSYPPKAEKRQNFAPHFVRENPTKTEQKLYNELIQTQPAEISATAETVLPQQEVTTGNFLRALALIENKALLLQQNRQFYLLPLTLLQKLRLTLLLQQPDTQKQPLLIPVVFRLANEQLICWQQQKDFFAHTGFIFDEHLAQHRITLNSVPGCLRQQNLQKLVISLLSTDIEKMPEFLTALCELSEFNPIHVFADAVNLLLEVERLIEKQNEISLQSLLIKIDFSHYLEAI